MNYLCDTHIFLWSLNGDKRLKDSIKTILKDPENRIFASTVSGWEISIKLQNNPKFRLKIPLEDLFNKTGVEILDIKLSHVLSFYKLSVMHKDPFDRMLVAQALAEGLTLITSDPKIWKYNVPVIRA